MKGTVSPAEALTILRQFYETFGGEEEGPTIETGPADLGPPEGVSKIDLEPLQRALADQVLLRQFKACKSLLDEVFSLMVNESLLNELSSLKVPTDDFEHLSNGVFWFCLAASLDKRDGNLPVTPFDAKIDIPLPTKIQMTVHGSLVLRLYVALVYMREGVLSRLVSDGARAQKTCCAKIKMLLSSDYVRRIRNALSHGTFEAGIAGLLFRDDKGSVVATPGFLEGLSSALMLIQTQAMAACAYSSS